MIPPIPTFPKNTASAAFLGSLSKLFLFDVRSVGLSFVRWEPEPLPGSFVGVGGSKVYFKPGTAAVTIPASQSASGPALQPEITFETIDDSADVLAWLTAVMRIPLFAVTFPVLGGIVRAFQPLQLSYEYKNTGDYAAAPRYLVTLRSKGLAKIWYTEMTAPTGETQLGPVLPEDPDEPKNPDNPNPQPPKRAFSDGFSLGFS